MSADVGLVWFESADVTPRAMLAHQFPLTACLPLLVTANLDCELLSSSVRHAEEGSEVEALTKVRPSPLTQTGDERMGLSKSRAVC